MSKIQIDRDFVELSLLRYIDKLLALPEITGVKLCDIVIQNNEYKKANLKEAVNKSYHDCYSDSGIYRIIFRDGTRYDFGFDFRQEDSYKDIQLQSEPERYSNPKWPVEKVDEFWFIVIQALGKLYRNVIMKTEILKGELITLPISIQLLLCI